MLDWEKAFDKVSHIQLFTALERMNVPNKMINIIKQLYNQPSFRIEMEEKTSEWTSQETGIRQGCPLSPYLFIILMSCLFHDIHTGDLQHKLAAQRITGMQDDEILYADDTICVTQDEEAMDALLAAIEKEGARYGLKLNRTKCEYLSFGNTGPVHFQNGTPVPRQKEVKYLGCNLNDRGDPGREVSKRISECMIILNKLHVLFYTSDNSITRKIQIYNAIIRAKLIYGLEMLAMNTAVLNRIDTFQLKGLRNILKLPTTYINREYSNAQLRTQINNKLKEANLKELLPLTAYHKQRRIKYSCQLICRGNQEPGTTITFDLDTLLPIDHGKQRIGQPRLKWYKVTLQDLWDLTKKHITTVKYASALNFENSTHIEAIKQYAQQGHSNK